MSNPYRVLGVSTDDSDEQIRDAYRKLAKKYHSDNYNDTPLSEFAEEKMKEINEAYDQIMEERRAQKASGSNYSSYNNSQGYYQNSSYADVRKFIMAGRIADAEQILDGVPVDARNAEWYFLKGTVLYKKGWLEEAYNNYSKACSMDPDNQEYRAGLNHFNSQRNGSFGGYNPMQTNRGCSGCDICSSLLCADCCCECMGGDCIRCC